MRRTVFILVYCTVIFCACNFNSKQRNIIVFNDDVKNVEDSLVKFERLLKRMKKNTPDKNTNYSLEENVININSYPFGNISSVKGDTIRAFFNFNSSEKKDFFIIAKYLQKNYITSGYLDNITGLWVFDYRKLSDSRSNNVRLITIIPSKDSILVHPWFKVLDHKHIVYLICSKDAEL